EPALTPSRLMTRSDTATRAARAGAGPVADCVVRSLEAAQIGRLSIEERVHFLLDWLLNVVRADSAIVYLQTPTGGLRRDASVGLAEIVSPPRRDLLDELAAGPVLHECVDDVPCDHWTADRTARMTVTLALEIEGRALGLAQLCFRRPRQID